MCTFCQLIGCKIQATVFPLNEKGEVDKERTEDVRIKEWFEEQVAANKILPNSNELKSNNTDENQCMVCNSYISAIAFEKLNTHLKPKDRYELEKFYSYTKEYYYKDNELHRNNGPAVTEYRVGNIITELYYKNGELHRADGPAAIDYYHEGRQIQSETYYKNGKRHRLDGPAEIWYYEDKSISKVYYYENGEQHRSDGPAIIAYHKNGFVAKEIFSKNGKHHRSDGPAIILYNSDTNSISCEEYFICNKQHRSDGPAIISYDKNGKVTHEEYWINDKRISKDEFLNLQNFLANSKEVAPYNSMTLINKAGDLFLVERLNYKIEEFKVSINSNNVKILNFNDLTDFILKRDLTILK